MSATSERDTSKTFYRSLVESGKTAIIVPLIIGSAVIVAVIMLWEAHYRKVRIAEMTRVEELVRVDLRNAYQELRAHNPQGALSHTAVAREKMSELRRTVIDDYADLHVALLLIEAESLFMDDCKANAATAEERFNRALSQMTRASGGMWLFGMIGRARTRYELGRYREAESDLDQIMERNPSFGAAYYWRSQARDRLGDAEGAAEDARRAWNLDSWPPLRDFMQPAGVWERDILCRPGECPDYTQQKTTAD